MRFLLKKPSAWMPLTASIAVLLMIFITWATSGLAHQADEGTEAHIFQNWLGLEALLIAFFGIKWFPRMPKETLLILAVQIIGVLAACFPVFYFNL